MSRVTGPGGVVDVFPPSVSCAQALAGLGAAGRDVSTLSCVETAGAGDDQPPPLANTDAGQVVSQGLIGGLIGAGLGFITGGPGGAIIGGLGGLFGGDDTPPPVTMPQSFAGGGQVQCPRGTFNVAGRCIDIQPGGETTGSGFIVPSVNGGAGGGQTSALGTPTVPGSIARAVRKCPPMHVLADLGSGTLCYHKKLIPNRLRLYPKAQRPALSAADKRNIRKYAKGGTKANQIKELAKELGFKVTN